MAEKNSVLKLQTVDSETHHPLKTYICIPSYPSVISLGDND
jgi:hypothetical protein